MALTTTVITPVSRPVIVFCCTYCGSAATVVTQISTVIRTRHPTAPRNMHFVITVCLHILIHIISRHRGAPSQRRMNTQSVGGEDDPNIAQAGTQSTDHQNGLHQISPVHRRFPDTPLAFLPFKIYFVNPITKNFMLSVIGFTTRQERQYYSLI